MGTLHKNKTQKHLKLATKILISLFLVWLFWGSRIRDGLTPSDVLAKRIYDREVYEFNGSVCRDGTISHSQGRGTCSWHGGVRYKFYKGQHKKTIQECQIEAKRLSWLD